MPERTVPIISIIVPVYNVRPWLRRCLDSVQAQTFTDWECILVDDGSTDGSAAVCDEYAARDPRFAVIHKENGGVSSARNAGLDAAKGEYIQFLDSDDWIDHRLLETAARLQSERPDGMVVWTWTKDEAKFAATAAGPLTAFSTSHDQQCWRENTLFVETCIRLFDAALIREHRLRFDTSLGHVGRVGEDEDFTRRYMRLAWGGADFPVRLISQPVYFYEQGNQQSLMHQTRRAASRPAGALPEPEAGYLEKLLAECARLRAAFDPAADPAAPPLFTRHYLRCAAFGVWSAGRLGEPLPENFFRRPELAFLLALAKERRAYSAYYLPFRLGLARLAARLYAWDEGGSIWYWRFYEVFYRLFFRGWEK